jgi:hypothetical protein
MESLECAVKRKGGVPPAGEWKPLVTASSRAHFLLRMMRKCALSTNEGMDRKVEKVEEVFNPNLFSFFDFAVQHSASSAMRTHPKARRISKMRRP